MIAAKELALSKPLALIQPLAPIEVEGVVEGEVEWAALRPGLLNRSLACLLTTDHLTPRVDLRGCFLL